jgi:hypothetical protein
MLSVASMMVVFVLKLCLATDVVFEFGYVDRSVDCWIMQVVFVGFRMLLIGFRALVEFVRLVARSARPLIVAAFCFCFGSFLLRPFTVCFYRKVSQRLAEGPHARRYHPAQGWMGGGSPVAHEFGVLPAFRIPRK